MFNSSAREFTQPPEKGFEMEEMIKKTEEEVQEIADRMSELGYWWTWKEAGDFNEIYFRRGEKPNGLFVKYGPVDFILTFKRP